MSKSDKKMGYVKPKYKEDRRPGGSRGGKGPRVWTLRIPDRSPTEKELAAYERRRKEISETWSLRATRRYADWLLPTPWKGRVIGRYRSERAAEDALEALRRDVARGVYCMYTAEQLSRAVVEKKGVKNETVPRGPDGQGEVDRG